MIPLYAWGTHREPLLVDLLDVTVDAEVRGELVDASRHRLRLDRAHGWTVLTLVVRVTVPRDTGVAEPASVTALVTSTPTRTRLPAVLAPVGDGSWIGEVRVPRALVAGSAELVADAVATVDGRVRLIGRTEPWTFVVDGGVAPSPPGAPPFPMTWVDFAAPDAPTLVRRVPDAPAVMDPARPMLYLNDGVEGLRGLLHADTARGERRRARDLVGAEVARTALTALVRVAVTEVQAADGEPPESHLSVQTLTAVACAMRSTADLEELCRRVSEASAGSPADLVALWTEIDGAVARLCNAPAAVGALAKESRNG